MSIYNHLKTPARLLPHFPLFLLLISFPLFAQEGSAQDPALAAAPVPQAKQVWYLSNASGLALDPAPSRIVALRNKYCLSLSVIPAASLPAAIRAYYDPSYIIDFRTLYENGKSARQQWVFRDGKGMARLNAAAAVAEAGPAFAFIERYDQNGFLQEERQFSDEGETVVSYSYRDRALVRAETHVKTRQLAEPQVAGDQSETALPGKAPLEKAPDDENAGGGDNGAGQISDTEERADGESRPPTASDAEKAAAGEKQPEPSAAQAATGPLVETAFYIDYYEYSRPDSLRAVRRVFQKGTAGGAARISFPPIRLHPALDTGFVKPGVAYESDFINEVLPVEPGVNIVYDVDKRGRIVKETRSDSEGAVIGEMKNNWAGDRIASIEWKSFDKDGKVADEKYTEYQYNEKGDRVAELNYNNGVLERTVKKSGSQEIEELYMNGKVVLRATWEGDKKVKEERVR